MRERLPLELQREVATDHPLAGRAAVALARCRHCDDALFQLDDGEFAFVHLVWHPNQIPPNPTFKGFRSWTEAVGYIEVHASDAGFT